MEELVPYIEKLRINGPVQDGPQLYRARVIVERSETIANGDIFPHFEGHRYRSLGTMQLIDGEEWRPNVHGVEVRAVEVPVFPIEPDGSSFIRMRISLVDVGLTKPHRPKKKRKKGKR